MPELPDVTVYVEALNRRIVGDVLERVRVRSPFVLRTVEPPVESVEGRRVLGVERLGKRIVIGVEGELFVVIHLMIAGRLRWVDVVGEVQDGSEEHGWVRTPSRGTGERRGTGKARGAGAKIKQALFDFGRGVLTLTEAGTKKRASIHVIEGRAAMEALGAGGVDVFECDAVRFGDALKARNNTLKRALTDPRRFDGIGNAYSDEILHAAGMSPLRLTSQLSEEQVGRLLEASRGTLKKWTEKLMGEFGLVGPDMPRGRFPGAGEITAFRPDFAVHGKYGKPCPVCGTVVQRILYAENECNYCPRCQTGGRMLADRAMSRLLKEDWPRTVEEWELEKGQSGS